MQDPRISGDENKCEGPITVSISRKVKPGFEKDYEEWEKGVIREASSFPGYLGADMIRPGAGTNYQYMTIYRFDSYLTSHNWETSKERKLWLEKVRPMLEGEPIKKKVSGLEVWFELPEIEMSKPAPRYKMALLITVVLIVLSISQSLLFGQYLEQLPWPVATLVVILVNVILMTYLLMPWLTRSLQKWLYSK